MKCCVLLASPIYLWSCTAPMKAALDRCIYALCKYYGDEKGPSLWEGKTVAGLPVGKGRRFVAGIPAPHLQACPSALAGPVWRAPHGLQNHLYGSG